MVAVTRKQIEHKHHMKHGQLGAFIGNGKKWPDFPKPVGSKGKDYLYNEEEVDKYIRAYAEKKAKKKKKEFFNPKAPFGIDPLITKFIQRKL